MARWKDSTNDFFPDGNGILFINQGGNSFIKLKSLNISGWDGSSFPVNGSKIILLKNHFMSFFRMEIQQ